MKKVGMLALFLAAGMAAFAGSGPAEETIAVDARASTVKWKAEKVSGSHEGMIFVKGGDVQVTNGEVVSGTLMMDMSSITVTDIEDKKSNQKLVGHLHSADFFDVANHSESKFVIKSIEKSMDNAGTAVYQITGELTIKGITKPAAFPAEIMVDGGKVTIKGKMTFNRTMWDIRYGSGSFFEGLGDRMIYDDVTIDFNVTASK